MSGVRKPPRGTVAGEDQTDPDKRVPSADSFGFPFDDDDEPEPSTIRFGSPLDPSRWTKSNINIDAELWDEETTESNITIPGLGFSQ